MDDNRSNENMENENDETSFGSSEYYKRLYDDMPEDVAEMLIGTHPLMKREVSEALTHNIKIRAAKEKNLRAVSEESDMDEGFEAVNVQEEPEREPEQKIVPSKDPVGNEQEAAEEQNKNVEEYLGDITSYTRGLVSSPAGKKQKKNKQEKSAQKEIAQNEKKSESDITAEMIAKMIGGGEVTPVDETEYEKFELDDETVAPESKVPNRSEMKEHKRSKKKRRSIEEKDLELSNIEKQANLNELFREDDDYYDEKHSGFSIARIAVIVAVIVVFAFLIYKAAALSGQVSKLNEQIETYKTMEQEYEQLKLDNLSLTEQVESLTNQLNGETSGGENTNSNGDDSTTPASTNNNSSGGGTATTSSTTYTVELGDTYWGIASKMYGNGSYYTKILSANDLSENDKLREGMTLTIPAL